MMMTTAIIKVKPTPIMELKTGVSSIGKWETGGETDETGATALEATTGSVRFSFQWVEWWRHG